MNISEELINEIHRRDIRIYGLSSGKTIIGEYLSSQETEIELGHAMLCVAHEDTFESLVPGEFIPPTCVICKQHIEYQSLASLVLKRNYLDTVMLSKIESYFAENIDDSQHIFTCLDPKGYTHDYWDNLSSRLLP